MYASALFHRKKAKKRQSSARRAKAARGTGNPCCPIIRVKCGRSFARGAKRVDYGPQEKGVGPTLAERLRNYKAAKSAFRKATGLGGTEPIHPAHENTSLPAAAKVIAGAKGNPAKRCTVQVAGRTYKGMTGAQAQAKVVELIRAQRAKRSVPKVERG